MSTFYCYRAEISDITSEQADWITEAIDATWLDSEQFEDDVPVTTHAQEMSELFKEECPGIVCKIQDQQHNGYSKAVFVPEYDHENDHDDLGAPPHAVATFIQYFLNKYNRNDTIVMQYTLQQNHFYDMDGTEIKLRHKIGDAGILIIRKEGDIREIRLDQITKKVIENGDINL